MLAIKPDSDEFEDRMMEFLQENVPAEFHLRKAAEECFELGEVIMKTLNKCDDKKPHRQELYKEFGDLVLRMTFVLNNIFSDQKQDYGIEMAGVQMGDKLIQMYHWLEEGRLYNLQM